ncbi:histone-like protein 18C isoform X2 [Drosophila elegans]|uniref:histone-like protein 18C isoform X2 n=1 Tax=Drosophila elegans TaxID=30023 RepID=UPI0007E6B73F|nr:histone-like protein 18C isoform X2 [Drosophila elegans]
MSFLWFKDYKTKKTLEDGLKSDIYVNYDGIGDLQAACSSDYNDESSYINFLGQYWTRYEDYYTDSQIEQAAASRWNDMSVSDRRQYSLSPPIATRGDTDCSSTSIIKLPSSVDSDVQMKSEPDTSKDTGAFFGHSSDECQRRKPKCVKPRKRCAKPRAKSKVKRRCAKPKPKCARAKPKCHRPRKKACSKPRPRACKAKPVCHKPRY